MERRGKRSPRCRSHHPMPDAKSTEWPSVGNIPNPPPESCVITGREASTTSPRAPLTSLRRKNTHFPGTGASTHEEEANAHGADASGAELSDVVGKATVREKETQEGVKSGTEAPGDSVVLVGEDPEVDPESAGPTISEEHPPRFRADERCSGEPVDFLDLCRNGASVSEGQPSHSVNERINWLGGDEKESTKRSKIEASEGVVMDLGRPIVECGEKEAMDYFRAPSLPWNPSLATGKFAAGEMKGRERSDTGVFVDESSKDSKAEDVALNTKMLAEAATEDDVKHFWKAPHNVADLNSNPEMRVGCQRDRAPRSARASAECPEDMRKCFVEKTFSPSDLGLGDGKKKLSRNAEKHEGQRPNTIPRGRNKHGIASLGCGDLHKASIDHDFGFDESQAVLGGVFPERLFSLIGMFHPEAPMKVGGQSLST